MIRLHQLTKYFGKAHHAKCVFENLNYTFPRGKSLGILGINGSGKSTLLSIIAGTEEPTSGWVEKDCRVSFRLGLNASFHGSMTGAESVRFACRIYDVAIPPAQKYVEDFAELGEDFYEPIRTYSSGMRARLAFGVSLALNFDVYLIDETTAVGDMRFQEKCRIELKEKMKDADVIMVSHSPNTVKQYCNHAAILHERQLSPIYELAEAMQIYQKILKR